MINNYTYINSLHINNEDNMAQPNVVFTIPLFYVNASPDDLFIVDGLSWGTEFKDFVNSGEELDDNTKKHLDHLAMKAEELKSNGILFAKRFIYIREDDRQMFPAKITRNGEETMNINLVEGPQFDAKLVEHKKVTIH